MNAELEGIIRLKNALVATIRQLNVRWVQAGIPPIQLPESNHEPAIPDIPESPNNSFDRGAHIYRREGTHVSAMDVAEVEDRRSGNRPISQPFLIPFLTATSTAVGMLAESQESAIPDSPDSPDNSYDRGTHVSAMECVADVKAECVEEAEEYQMEADVIQGPLHCSTPIQGSFLRVDIKGTPAGKVKLTKGLEPMTILKCKCPECPKYYGSKTSRSIHSRIHKVHKPF